MYAHEDAEWRSAVHQATDAELEAAQDSPRAAQGIVGDADDDCY